MSLLAYHARPLVAFDPTNVHHRQWLGEIQRSGTFGRCPVRFYVTEPGSTLQVCQRMLVDYYTAQEFAAE